MLKPDACHPHASFIMTPKNDGLPDQIRSPSLGAVSYQAQFVVDALRSLSDEDFPEQAHQLRNVFLCIAEHIRDKLLSLYGKNDLPKRGTDGQQAVRNLAIGLQRIYSFIRYISASSPKQSPPAIQAALASLTDLYFPKKNGTPFCIVRPQWKYNLTSVSLQFALARLFADSLLVSDRDEEFTGIKKKELGTSVQWVPYLKRIWKKWRQKEVANDPGRAAFIPKRAPIQLAVLSFAGLDTQDPLFFPILGHELGHFIESSYKPALSVDRTILKKSRATDAVINKMIGNDVLKKRINYRAHVNDCIDSCIRELLADRVAIRMLGFGFFAAQSEFLKTGENWKPFLITRNFTYPAIRLRLCLLLGDIEKDRTLIDFLSKNARGDDELIREVSEKLLAYLEEWSAVIGTEEELFASRKGKRNATERLIEGQVRKALPEIEKVAEKAVKKRSVLKQSFFERIRRLRYDLPPSLPREDEYSFAEISSATWAYQFVYGEKKEVEKQKHKNKLKEYNKTCRLMMKAIELIPALQSSDAAKIRTPVDEARSVPTQDDLAKGKGVLSPYEIERRMTLDLNDENKNSRMEIMPFDPNLLNGASLDVRLGNWFSVAKRTRLEGIEIGDKEDEAKLANVGKEEIFINNGKSFLLHPGDFVLGVTLEFVALPDDVMAFVEGKSRLGRLGLLVATAAQIAPGFHGAIVLELVNAGTVPLKLSPGKTIAQIVFQRMDSHIGKPHLYDSEKDFYCQMKP